MKVLFFVCSESASMDSQSGRISLYHIWEDLNVSAVPVVLPGIAAVAHLQKEPKDKVEIEATVQLTSNGSLVASVPTVINFKDNKTRHRNIVQFQGVVIPALGEFEIRLVVNKRTLARWTMHVNQVGVSTTASSLAPVSKKVPQKKAGSSRKKRS